MKVGDLVKWSLSWIAGSLDEDKEKYRNETGFVLGKSEELPHCWWVAWNSGSVNEVHRDYLEVICE